MMNILLHCGGMPFNGTTIEHQSLGGSETSAYYLARELVTLGHRVTVFTSCDKKDEGIFEGVNYVSHGTLTKHTPMGNIFHAYAENTPHDVMIIQRHPQAFQFKWASKVNIWWCHDLALKRSKQEALKQMWNIDALWVVSEYHKKQIHDVWGISNDIIHTVHNGIDQMFTEHAKGSSLPDKIPVEPFTDDKKVLIYSSRPERGLEHLVAPNGIMERLGDDYHLIVCAYDNVTEVMKSYYDYLAERCNELPNVTLVGGLTKLELYTVMHRCYAHVYPTNFEEVSCITAMEDMACGLPLITSEHAALPETCKGSGTVLIKLKNNDVSIDRFVSAIKAIDKTATKLVEKQGRAAPKFYWSNVINDYLDSIDKLFLDKTQESIVTHLVEHSDIHALKYYYEHNGLSFSEYSQWLINKTLPLFNFSESPKSMAEHYENYYGKSTLHEEDLSNNSRFNHIASLLDDYSDSSSILDYGCGHGHYTINLAKRYPGLNFIGVDVSGKNIQFAKDWAERLEVTNVQFFHADITQGFRSTFWSEFISLDAVICCEVAEHVVDYKRLLTKLEWLLKDTGKMIISTPYGRWEWQSFKEYGTNRFHLHHFERQDITEIMGTCLDNFVTNIPSGSDHGGYLLGCYVWGWTKHEDNQLHDVNYDRKIKYLKPRQLCSLNMIVKDCENTIAQAIDSTLNFVDEIVIGIDRKSTDNTLAIIMDKYLASDIHTKIIHIDSPLEIGFNEARNEVLKESSLEWILWIDSDEVAYIDDSVPRLLRSNQFNGYATKQHHYSVDPAGILKTDLPLRVFRNNKGIKFHGVIHEHPEIKLNDGAGRAQLIDNITIGHYGYDDETTRKGRFERNLSLMIRDRDENPERKLGKMLWIRDLSLMNQYELEGNGMKITEGIMGRCHAGIKVWRELVKDKETRLVLDSMQFYNQLVELVGESFEMELSIGMGKSKGSVTNPPAIKGLFVERKDAENLAMLLLDENYDEFNSRYY